MRFNGRFAPSSDPTTWRVILCTIVILVGVAVLGPPADAQPAAPTEAALLHAFASMPGLYARFHEEKHIALLTMPIESDGEIFFAPPGRLMRKVNSPTPSWALLEGDRITLASPGERRVLDLGTSPVVRGFVGAFRDVLAGDRAALERNYNLHFSTEGEHFTLVLRPRRPELARFLRELTLHGRGRALTRIHMVETSGDVTDTTFTDVDPTRRYTPSDLAHLFRLP